MSTSSMPSPIPSLEQDILTDVVRTALGHPSMVLDTWTVQPIANLLNTSTAGLYRISGTCRDGTSSFPWSVILKVVSAPPEPRSIYWHREALVYRSSLLTNLPAGLTAPRCFGVHAQPGLRYWIWLEDLADMYAGQWPLTRYRLAAYHLGAFNGAYLSDRPLPSHPWIQLGGMQARPVHVSAYRTIIEDPTIWDNPFIQATPLVSFREQWLAVLKQAKRLQAAFVHLPQTLCHLDAAYFNLFARRSSQGHEQTVAIDWAMLGLAAVGEEMSVLIWPSLMEFQIDLDQAAQLEREVQLGYLEGLRDAGWRGDERLISFACTAHAILRWICFPHALYLAGNRAAHAELEALLNRPVSEILTRYAEVTALLFERVEEVEALCRLLAHH
jgi:hypothetical protein